MYGTLLLIQVNAFIGSRIVWARIFLLIYAGAYESEAQIFVQTFFPRWKHPHRLFQFF